MLINYFHKQFKLSDYLMQMVKFPVCEKKCRTCRKWQEHRGYGFYWIKIFFL